MTDTVQPVALITGASRGLGLEIARLLAERGMGLILTARNVPALERAANELSASTDVLALPGDISDEGHAAELARQGLARFGKVDILINNASELGPSPLPELGVYPLDRLEQVFRVNVIAPLHLVQLVLPGMKQRGNGVIINVTSDAGVEAYPTWGGYGASKSALEHLSRILAAELEETGIRVYVVDPGDMNTQMHQEAKPGEDLSHLPSAAVSAPAFLRLVEDETAPFGRLRAQDFSGETSQEFDHAGA